MTRALLLIAWALPSIAQTGITASQVVCPAAAVPVAAVALPSTVPGARPRLVCLPLDPASFTIDSSTSPPMLRFIGLSFVEGEVPSGAIDGSNATFRLASPPAPASSLRCYRNGIRQQAGQDYALVVGQSITFAAPSASTPGSIPQPGDSLLCDYRK